MGEAGGGGEDADGIGGGDGSSAGPGFWIFMSTLYSVNKCFGSQQKSLTEIDATFLPTCICGSHNCSGLMATTFFFLCLFAKGHGVVRIGNLRARTLFELNCTQIPKHFIVVEVVYLSKASITLSTNLRSLSGYVTKSVQYDGIARCTWLKVVQDDSAAC
jgi:hypothetical protein